MLLRKINAGISLLITALLFAHAIDNAVWMLSRGAIAKVMGFMPWVLTGLMLIHAFICIDMVLSGVMEENHHPHKAYLKMNLPTLVQRISGGLMIVFTGLHIAGATKFLQPPPLVHAILPPLFFAVTLAHVAVSTEKAFVTLGIGNAHFVKAVGIVTKGICGATLIAVLTGFYLHVC